MRRLEDIHQFYAILDKLKQKTGYRKLGECNGKINWPKRGLYFFFEKGELREDNEGLRVVRVGTHAVSKNSKTHLWDRLRGHRGTMSGKNKDGGNHRGSIFRLHIGTALINKENLQCESWSNRSSVSSEIRNHEYPLEVKVSETIRNMPFLWLEADDEPGLDSIRKYIERNTISLLSNFQKEMNNPPFSTWLGASCENKFVQKSGLWNVNHTGEDYDHSFIEKLNALVEVVNRKNPKLHSVHTIKNVTLKNPKFKLDHHSLMILPCCAKKYSGGDKWRKSNSGLKSVISAKSYQSVLESRRQVISLMQRNEKYLADTYKKNRGIVMGPEVGYDTLTGHYMTAIHRYNGSLYSASASFPELIYNCLEKDSNPKILILSALYGPLHPFDLIQDYNLKMSDKPAYKIWGNIFPDILKDYILKNSIKNIYLYLGKSSYYMKVTRKAVTPLLEEKLISKVVYYEVENGNSYHTPHNHGVLIAKQLTGVQTSGYTRPIKAIKLRVEPNKAHRSAADLSTKSSRESKKEEKRMMKIKRPLFDVIWKRIINHQGEEFKTKTGTPFKFKIHGEIFKSNRTKYNISKKDFEKAYALVPIDGPGDINNIVRGPAYIWAVLHDRRVRSSD